MTTRTLPAGVLACLLLFAAPRAAWAWHRQGHELTARAAVAALPDDLPAFFRDAGDAIARGSTEPDLFRNKATPELAAGEGPEHFIDAELLQGRDLPDNRPRFVALCAELKIEPSKVGFVPYAVTEWTQRLAVAFAEHRAKPDDAAIRARCLVYAGLLAHYAADLCQPLHTTVHFDGRVGPDGKRTGPGGRGIHESVDDLPERLALTAESLGRVEAVKFERVFPAVAEALKRSHALVDRVYELEPRLPASPATQPADDEVRAFAVERTRAAAAFIASLYRTAWEQSAKVELPAWWGADGPPAPGGERQTAG